MRLGATYVGRGREFAAVGEVVGRVLAGVTTALRVEAAPGAGLTEFLGRVAVRHAGDLDVRVVSAEEVRGEFAVALELLRLPEASLAAAGAGRRSFFEAGVPGAANAAAVELLLRRAEVDARDRPQLWVIDDAHLAGRGARVVLAELLRAGSVAVGVVYGTHDPDLPPLAGEDAVTLGPLGADEIAELLATELAATPSQELIDAFVAMGGSPLAVTSALAAVDPGALVMRDGAVTLPADRLVELARRAPEAIAERLRALVGDRLLAAAAAVIGPRFDVADVAAILGEPLRDCIVGLAALEAAGVIVSDGAHYRFARSHDRRAAIDACPGPVRAALHTEAARRLMERDDDPVRVAEHLLAAGGRVPGDVEWLTTAAERIVRFDPLLATELLDRAVALTPDPPRRLRIARARATAMVGRVDEAEALAEALLGDAAGDEAALLHRDRAMTFFRQGRAADTVAALDAAVDRATDPRLQARMTAESAMAKLLAADFVAAREVADLGSKRGESIGDLATVLAAELVGCLVAFYQYDIAEAVRLAGRLETLSQLPEAGEATLYQPWFGASLVRTELYQFEHARRLNAAGRARAIETGYLWMGPAYDALDAYAAWEAGELDDAVASATAALAWGLDDTFGTTIWCHAFLGRIAATRGDLATAAAEAEAARQLLLPGQAQFGWEHLALLEADLALRSGKPETACRVLRDIWELFAAFGIVSARQRVSVALVPLLCELESWDLLAEIRADLEQSARRTGSEVWQAEASYAHAWERRDAAALERVATTLGAAGRTWQAGRTLVEAALVAERSDRAEARRLARAAADVLDPIGATAELDRIRHLVAAGTSTGRRPALSRRERAVAELVAAGLTNTEIAERLYVSRRTVESHVSSAYRKLGLNNRVELARAILAG